MVKGVFTHSAGSIYDDRPDAYYHFPRVYLGRVEQTVGDWIIYYEPRRLDSKSERAGGRQSYFAIARVEHIENDPHNAELYYARVSNYIDFTRPTPFSLDGGYFEAALRRTDGKTNRGAFGHAVRIVDDAEFEAICQHGFSGVREELESEDWAAAGEIGFSEEPAAFQRPVIETLVNRKFRDAAFARLIKSAYGETCAMTGLRILNGGGRPEVEAAHIMPVKENGPDTIRNGLALSRTAHWMFDRGLVSVSDDHRILVNEAKAPSDAIRLLSPSRRLILPKPRGFAPHPAYLAHHRATHGF